MTDKPILFSAPMLQALLDGRKTQTRRVLSLRGYKGFHQFGASDTTGYDWTFRRADWVWEDFRHERLLQMLPYAIGNRLWVKEAWRAHAAYDALPPRDIPVGCDVQYMADDPLSVWDSRYRNARFMPRWASRLTLTVTDVRVQRLQDISEADAIAEGVAPNGRGWFSGAGNQAGDTPRAAYSLLWNSLHGPDAWDANPWVAALTFDVQRKNIDKETQ